MHSCRAREPIMNVTDQRATTGTWGIIVRTDIMYTVETESLRTICMPRPTVSEASRLRGSRSSYKASSMTGDSGGAQHIRSQDSIGVDHTHDSFHLSTFRYIQASPDKVPGPNCS